MSIFRSLSREQLKTIYRIALVAIAISLAILWQQIQTPQSLSTPEREATTVELSAEPIQPLPTAVNIDQRKFQLGETLFKEPALSATRQVSCTTCHKLNRGGTDNTQYSKGINDALTKVNTPTVFNVAYNFRFNWDGQHENLVSHTDKLMQNPTVMGGEWGQIQTTLNDLSSYRQAFETIYDDGVTKDNIIDAIVTYETGLVTPNSPFDKYLSGDETALSTQAKEGYSFFKAYGCASCHQGTNLGGNMFQKFGVIGNYFSDQGDFQEADLGRFNVTQNIADRHVFRVPSLRNVALTSPYLHNGTADSLEDAINVMVKYQLGRSIPAEHVTAIAQFLQSLTGEYQGVSLSDMTNVIGEK